MSKTHGKWAFVCSLSTLLAFTGCTEPVARDAASEAAPAATALTASPAKAPDRTIAAATAAIAREQRLIQEGPDGTLVANGRGCRATLDADGMTLVPSSLRAHPWSVRWSWAQIGAARNADARLGRSNFTASVMADGVRETLENRPDGIEHRVVVERRPAGDSLVVRVGLETTLTPTTRSGADQRIAFLDARGREVLEYRGLQVWDASGDTLPATMRAERGAIRIDVAHANAAYPITIDPVLSSAAEWIAEGQDLLEPFDTEFGFAVANVGDMDGDGLSDMVIGAPGYDTPAGVDVGAAFVFINNDGPVGIPGPVPAFAWTSTGPDQEGARFGAAVAGAGLINADAVWDLIVGAPEYDNAAGADAGAAYIFLASGIGGAPVAPGPPIVLEGDQEGGRLGAGVSTAFLLDGDAAHDVVVGAPGYNAPTLGGPDAEDAGAAFIYLDGTLAGLPPFIPDRALYGESQELAQFGFAVAYANPDGDALTDIIVGAPTCNAPGDVSNTGAAYVYSGVTLAPPLPPPGGYLADWTSYGEVQEEAQFGFSLIYPGNVNGPPGGPDDIVIGAPFFDTFVENEGRAYVYAGTGTPPPFAPLGALPLWFSSGDDQEGALFGYSVGGSNPNADAFFDVLVGAPGFDSDILGGGTNVDAGAAYLYTGAIAGPGPVEAWTSSGPFPGDGQAGARFGHAVFNAMDQNDDGAFDVVVTAPEWDEQGMEGMGSAFVFYDTVPPAIPPVPPAPPPFQLRVVFGATVAEHGYAVAAGDVNGDGIDDVIVGAPGSDIEPYVGFTQDVGHAYLYLGREDGLGLEDEPVWDADGGGIPGSRFGTEVAVVGYVNDDIYADVIVTAPGTASGTAYLYLGNEDGLDATYAWSASGDGQIGAGFGWSVSGTGDLNGDTFDDVIIGAPYFDSPRPVGPPIPNTGTAYVYYSDGGVADLLDAYAWRDDGMLANGAFGWSVAGVGNVNCDGSGYADLLIGAPFANIGGFAGRGAAYMYRGDQTTGLLPNPTWNLLGPAQTGAAFGRAVAAGGNLDDAGCNDFVVAAPSFNTATEMDVGIVYAYLGTSVGVPAAAWWSTGDEVQGVEFGASLAGGGDVNDDDVDDLLVGTPYMFGGPGAVDGAAWVYLGDDDGAPFDMDFDSSVLGFPDWQTNFGIALTFGYVNDDEYADVIVGSPGGGAGRNGQVFEYDGP